MLCRLVDYKTGEDILTRFASASHLLKPVPKGGDFGPPQHTLADTKKYPTLRGTWLFKSLTTTGPNYIIQITWTLDENSEYEKMTPKFYTRPAGKQTPEETMDIKLLELGK